MTTGLHKVESLWCGMVGSRKDEELGRVKMRCEEVEFFRVRRRRKAALSADFTTAVKEILGSGLGRLLAEDK